MTMTQEANELLMGGGGAKSAAFNAAGDSVTGFVVAIDARQATDIKTKMPATWPDGNKKMVSIITLQTEEHDDEDDDGQRAVWVPIPSQIRTVIAEAVRKAGEKSIEDGGKLRVKLERIDKPTRQGFNGQKIYSAQYRAPDRSQQIMTEEPPYESYAEEAQPF